MKQINSEVNVTWSSIEKDYIYDKVLWAMRENGIPSFSLFYKNKKVK